MSVTILDRGEVCVFLKFERFFFLQSSFLKLLAMCMYTRASYSLLEKP